LALDLANPPEGVSTELWRGIDPSAPSIGELWLLSWDNSALALGIVAGVGKTFVLIWPVTLVGSPVFAPAIEVTNSPLGIPVLVWPTRETGVGLHMLHRRFGSLMSERTMALVLAAVEGDSEYPLPLARHNIGGTEAERASDSMVEEWDAIGSNVWPEPVAGESPLAQSALRAAGLKVSDIASLLGISVPHAVGYFNGQLSPSAGQVDAIAEATGLSFYELLRAQTDDSVALLLHPEFKDYVVTLASSLGLSEASARSRVRADFALAARSTGDARGRLHAAFERLRSSG
jgi:transcriptional regulator with XRE-family HTH domain